MSEIKLSSDEAQAFRAALSTLVVRDRTGELGVLNGMERFVSARRTFAKAERAALEAADRANSTPCSILFSAAATCSANQFPLLPRTAQRISWSGHVPIYANPGFWVCGVFSVFGLFLLVRSFRRIETAAFFTTAGIHRLTIAKIGPAVGRFQDFVERVASQIALCRAGQYNTQ